MNPDAPALEPWPLRHARLLAAGAAFALALASFDATALFIVNQPWVSPAHKGQSTRAYMNLTSTDEATLVSARTEDATSISVRSARDAVVVVALPARSEIALAPGREHLTLKGIKRTFRLGERVKMTLTVRDDSGALREIEVDAEVRTRSPIDDERRAHHHDH
jgi:copper(I)-binding protein